ncbi:uncharacterized protein LOC141593982 [Silene latifolia]|uniref:uncharacterized protein LOC141593951 n=1 Tax=Silene latifolia TaxID=37657 RepID=UPI003D787D27
MNSGGGNSKTIEDLDNNMLAQILFRFPSGKFVVGCKLVSKRWCSLISDPKFASQFSNYKKEITTYSESSPIIDDGEPPWTFIANITYVIDRQQYCWGNVSINEAMFGTPQFSIGFLPYAFVIEATFKDLVLCSEKEISRIDQVYFITNPLTKQWVALPPCPVFSKSWVGLVCQEPCDYTQDYKFRVVVIDQCPPPVYDLMVYCSEIGEWKKFNLRVSIMPELAAQKHHFNDSEFEGVVCNGIIYLLQRLYFAAFNPFDVDETTSATTIEAKALPSFPYPINGYLRESSGQLFIIHNPNKDHYVCYQKHGRVINFPFIAWKLDPNQVPLIWKMTFDGSCTGNANKIESSCGKNLVYDMSVSTLGMHPKNDKLIYMHLHPEEQLVSCDTRTRLIKPLKSLQDYRLETFHRLELQWWPTPVPKAYLSE